MKGQKIIKNERIDVEEKRGVDLSAWWRGKG